MTVTAVVCAYWPERFGNVEIIVHDMLNGSVVPDTIIVLNNNPDHPDALNQLRDGPVKVMGGWNTECRGKFVAGLFAPADYYLLNDDDTSVEQGTLAHLLSHARRGFVTGYWGVTLHPVTGGFSDGTIHIPAGQNDELHVDTFHGRSMFMAHDALVRMFAVEESCRLEPGQAMVGDDILAGLANDDTVVIPMRGDQCWKDLSEQGVSMFGGREGYRQDRDDFARRVIAAR